MYIENIFDIPELTELERETQACVVAKIAFLEERIAAITERTLSGGAQPVLSDQVEAEMAKAELMFWRSRDRRDFKERQPKLGSGEAPGFFLVPARPSRRALRLAHGYTDLADISASPLDRSATLEEIELAVRIANEEDGIPVMFDPDQKEETSPAEEALSRQEARKVDLERLSDTEHALIVAYARLTTLKEAADGIAKAQGAEALAEGASAMRATLERQEQMARKPFGLDRFADAVAAHTQFYRP